ncbi:MAG TPA: Ig-like domain-containing protein [Candidatus Acidoferrales bacterium]|nr:Ig-like domain-containing protein [Candidatus Acidoferrales bacterium]
MKTKTFTAVCLLLLISCFLATASAKPSLSLYWTQNSGFNTKTGITGTWTITPLFSDNGTQANATYIEFYLDNQLQKTLTQTPFSWSFNTDNYAEGTHTIKVIAYNALGQSATVEEQRNFTGFPVISVVGALLFASVVFAFVLLATWFLIHEKAHKRRIQKTTKGS